MPELTEEQQVEALLKEKANRVPGLEKDNTPPADKIDDDNQDDDPDKGKPADDADDKGKNGKEGKDDKGEGKDADEPELSEEELQAKLDEIQAKDEKDLTDEDKEFLEKYTEEESDLSPDDYIKSSFGEKYEINNEEELIGFIETATEIIKERDELKAKLEASKEPQYKSESQKKVAEFLEKTGYDPEKFTEGLQTYTQVMVMDLDDNSLDPKIILEAKYVIDHPELTRAEAQRKFAKEYDKKFVVKSDDFDDEEKFKDAEEDARIERKSAVARAIKELKKVQAEYKVEPAKDKDHQQTQVDPVVAKSIEQNNSKLNDHLNEADQIVFSPTENEDDDFAVKLSKDQLKGIRAVCKSILDNPGSYDKKGKLVFGSDVEELSRRVADFLYGDDFREKLYEHARTVTAAKRLEDAAEVKPNRTPRSAGPINKDAMSEEDQIEMLIAKKKSASKR